MRKIFLLIMLSQQLFTNAQNIGIGIINPTLAKFQVNGVAGNGKTVAIFGGESTGVSFQKDWPTIGFNQYRDAAAGNGRYMATSFAAVQYLDPVNGYMAIDMLNIWNGGTLTSNPRRALSISPLGNISIGSASYNGGLTVARTNGATAYLYGTTHHSAFSFGAEENTYIRAGKSNSSVVINDIPNGKVSMTGFVGINTATPVFPLEIRQANNKGLVLVEQNTFNNWGFRVYPNAGDLELAFNGTKKGQFNASNGAYVSISDKRLKKNIEALPSLLDKVMKLQPLEYEMMHNNPDHKKTFGFIAQDVQTLFPELVTVFSDTTHGYKGINDLHSLNYDGFAVLAIKAIQQQDDTIENQKQSIEALQNKLRKLKQLVSNKK